MIRKAIERIQQMEQYFELLLETEIYHPDALMEDASICGILQTLTDYYTGGQWLRDYELDEQGLLPQDLRRGVLAQDAVYDLLERIKLIRGESSLDDYPERIVECIDYLKSIRFPCEDWKADKVFFDELEQEFSEEATDAQTAALLAELRELIAEKRALSLNMNKTTEELYAGWDD